MTWDILAVMRKYAYEHLKTPNDSLGAVRRAMGGDSSGCYDDITASNVAYSWPDNVFVRQFKREWLEELGEDHFLPSKSDIIRELHSIGTDRTLDTKDRVAALKECALIRGFIEKPATVNVNTGLVNNKVMVVQDHGSDDAWETKAATQQAKLIASARRSKV
jgi:hypothetical protein